MFEKQRAAISWRGFLPEGAVVAVVAAVNKRAPVSAEVATPSAIQTEGNPESQVAFVGPAFDSLGGEAARELFRKMLASISLTPEQVQMVWLDPSQFSSVDQLREQVQAPAGRIWVALETEARNGVNGARLQLPHPARILQDGSLKAPAWNVLQELARELGLQIANRRRS